MSRTRALPAAPGQPRRDADVPHVQDIMAFEGVRERLLEVLRSDPDPSPEDSAKITELGAIVLTPTRKESIEYNYAPKVEFLLQRKVEGLTSLTGRCLRKL